MSKAKDESDQLRAEAQREVEEIEIRKQEIKAEMSRVHGVMDALASSVSVPVGPPRGSAGSAESPESASA